MSEKEVTKPTVVVENDNLDDAGVPKMTPLQKKLFELRRKGVILITINILLINILFLKF